MQTAINHSVKLFENTTNGVDYGPIFETVLKDKNGPAILNKALQGKKIDSAVALLGVQRANIGGRDLSTLLLL